MEITGYIAAILMGTMLGLTGGGGSILAVPIIVYLFQIVPSVATGYSLFVVGLTASAGAVIYFRKGEVDIPAGLLFALPSAVGVTLSRTLLVPSLPPVIFSAGSFVFGKDFLIMASFAALMVTAALAMIRKKSMPLARTARTPKESVRMSLQGLLVGILAGFVGAGGGFLIVPTLVILAGLPMRRAIGTSLTIIAFQSLIGFLGDLARGPRPDWIFLGSFAVLAMAGMLVGSALAQKVNETKLKISFGWFVLAVGAAILAEQIHRLT